MRAPSVGTAIPLYEAAIPPLPRYEKETNNYKGFHRRIVFRGTSVMMKIEQVITMRSCGAFGQIPRYFSYPYCSSQLAAGHRSTRKRYLIPAELRMLSAWRSLRLLRPLRYIAFGTGRTYCCFLES